MNIKPLFDRVLLKPYHNSQPSSLITPLENEGNKMIVIATGTKDNFLVKPNDIVLINKYSGSEFIINNNTYILIKENDILGIIEEKTNE